MYPPPLFESVFNVLKDWWLETNEKEGLSATHISGPDGQVRDNLEQSSQLLTSLRSPYWYASSSTMVRQMRAGEISKLSLILVRICLSYKLVFS